MPDRDMRTPPSKKVAKQEAADYAKRGATAKQVVKQHVVQPKVVKPKKGK